MDLGAPTYILGGLLVGVLGECEGLGEGPWPFLQVADDEDQAERERHPRRHVEEPATINSGGWRSVCWWPLLAAEFAALENKKFSVELSGTLRCRTQRRPLTHGGYSRRRVIVKSISCASEHEFAVKSRTGFFSARSLRPRRFVQFLLL